MLSFATDSEPLCHNKALILLGILLVGIGQTLTSSQLENSFSAEENIQTIPSNPDPVGKLDPSLQNAQGSVKVLVTVSSDSLDEVAESLHGFRAIPVGRDVYTIRAIVSAAQARSLASLPSVLSVLEDKEIGYEGTPQRPTISLPLSFAYNDYVNRDSQRELERYELGTPEAQLRDILSLTGVSKVWQNYSLKGSNVTIAVIDTGVDYSSLTLGYWDVISRTREGQPALFDADGESVVLTNSTFVETETRTGLDTWLVTGGSDPLVYFSFLIDPPYQRMPPVARFSELTGHKWPYSMNITGIASASRVFHFGFLIKFYPPGYPERPFLFFPVLVVDSVLQGVFDTVYVDLSTAWSLWSGNEPDLSFSDEMPLSLEGRLTASRDLTGDGIHDLSAGSLGYFLDVWGASPDDKDRGQVLQPIAQNGNYVVLSDDWWGHGTYAAASAAGRDPKGIPVDSNVGPGVAPDSRVMSIIALFIGDVLESHLWAAGFDLKPMNEGWITSQSYGRSYGIWRYTGNHSADIISNSWGISAWPLAFNRQPWYDLMAVFQDALSMPGYLDPEYPGITIVHAVGNGGPGYGTVTSPGYSSLALGVGASTSFDSASPLTGRSDQIISWSARGPTPLGTVKPDLVNVGAWAWVAGPTWVGEGNGANSFDVFGGTSMATPLTAGSAALVIESYERQNGHKPDPPTVKTILKSTAKDLGYDAFVQGAGRINVLRAVSLASSSSGILVESKMSWDNLRKILSPTWNILQVSYGDLLKSRPPSGPVSDFGWYAGPVPANSRANATLHLHNYNMEQVIVTIEPKTTVQVGETTVLQGITDSNLTGWLEGVGDLVPLPSLNIPFDADLLVARLSVDFAYFDSNSDYEWDRRFRLFLLDWLDDGDTVVQPDEVDLVNYGYNAGTTIETRAGFPTSTFKGVPVAWISQVGIGAVPYKVELSFFGRKNWSWVQAERGITISPNSSGYARMSLTVPTATKPGVYEGQLVISPTAEGQTSVLPISVIVPAKLSPDSLSLELSFDNSNEIYDPLGVNGLFDWRWRYESGDWRNWYFTVDDPSVVAAVVSSLWNEEGTDIDMFSVDPVGFIVGGTGWRWRGGGIFEKATSGHLEESVVLYPGTVSGFHTVLLHNVLSGGGSNAESLRTRIQFVVLNPAPSVIPPVKVAPGSWAVQDFVLSSGRALGDARFTLEPSNLAVNVTGLPRMVEENSANRIRVQMAIPEGTPQGIHTVTVRLYSKELSNGVPIELKIQVIDEAVEPGPPTVRIDTGTHGRFIRSVVLFKVIALSERTVREVSLQMGMNELPLEWSSRHNAWITYVDTARFPDGQHLMSARAIDIHGKTGYNAVLLDIDNTPPTVFITSPRPHEILRGKVLFDSHVEDAHLDHWQFLTDGRPVESVLRGQYELDTVNLGNGPHSLKIIATDLAGNVAEASVDFSVDNTLQEVGTAPFLSWMQVFVLAVGGVVLLTTYRVKKRRSRDRRFERASP